MKMGNLIPRHRDHSLMEAQKVSKDRLELSFLSRQDALNAV